MREKERKRFYFVAEEIWQRAYSRQKCFKKRRSGVGSR